MSVARWWTAVSMALAAPLATAAAQDPGEAAFRAIYRELVEIDTSLARGDCSAAAQAMAARLRAAGFADADLRLLGPADRPREQALVATLRGSERNAAPVLLLAHIDVVEARREDWQRDPFTLVEENGFFYGRGTSDDKAMAAIFVDSLLRYRAEGYRPRRDIKLALTCGEETSQQFNSVQWLLQHHPDALQAGFAINEGANGELDAAGKPVALQVQAGEKVYQDFALEVTHSGGHSARPVRENAIQRLSAAVGKVAAYRFPVQFNDVTRGYFEQQSKLVKPGIAADMRALLANPADDDASGRLWDANPAWNAMLRTTCVPTRLDAGHANNALPQRARANINCRVLPGVAIEAVQATLVRLVDDPEVHVTLDAERRVTSPPPRLTPQVIEPVRKLVQQYWPGTAVVPTMATGATDGRFLNAAGIPTFGITGLFYPPEGSNMHGLNERIPVKSLYDGRRFLHELVRIYASQKD